MPSVLEPIKKIKSSEDFSGGPVVKTPHVLPTAGRMGWIPGQRTKVPYAMLCGKRKKMLSEFLI